MSNKNCLLLYQNRYYTRIEIRSDMQNYDDSIKFIIDLLSYAAKGKNVFVEYYGNNSELEDSNNVIEKITDTKDELKKALWMRNTWLSVTNKSFIEERYIMLHILDRDYSWADFLRSLNSNFRKKIRIPQLQLLALFGDCEFPCLYIKKGHSAEKEILRYYKRKDYVFKHSIS